MKRTKAPVVVATSNKYGPKVELTEDHLKQVEWLTKLGATNKQLAEFFEVSDATIEGWIKKYPEFKEAKRRGGIEADMKVVQSLYKRAVGYSYIETEYSAVTDIETGQTLALEDMAKVKKTKKRIPPDVKAALQWLQIKHRAVWSNINQHAVVGTVNHVHQDVKTIPVQELTPEAQKLVFEIAQKQLALSQTNSSNGNN